MLNVTAQRGSARNVGSGEWNTALAVRNAVRAWKKQCCYRPVRPLGVWVLAGAGVKVLEADALHDSSRPLSQAIDCECEAAPKRSFLRPLIVSRYCSLCLFFLLELLKVFFWDLIKVCTVRHSSRSHQIWVWLISTKVTSIFWKQTWPNLLTPGQSWHVWD